MVKLQCSHCCEEIERCEECDKEFEKGEIIKCINGEIHCCYDHITVGNTSALVFAEAIVEEKEEEWGD